MEAKGPPAPDIFTALGLPVAPSGSPPTVAEPRRANGSAVVPSASSPSVSAGLARMPPIPAPVVAPPMTPEPPSDPSAKTKPELPVPSLPRAPGPRLSPAASPPGAAAAATPASSPGYQGLADLLEPGDEPAGSPGLSALDAELSRLDEAPTEARLGHVGDGLDVLLGADELPEFPTAAPPGAPSGPPLPGRRPPPSPIAAAAAPAMPAPPVAGNPPPAPASSSSPGLAPAAVVPSMVDVGPELDVDIEEVADSGGRRGAPWAWIALTVMLAAGLGWVLYTQTDLFSGDVIAKRNADARAEAEAELADAKAEQERAKVEYGTLSIDSEPEGARVWWLESGPEATFDNLPVDNEYMVAVMAPGFEPRVRIVKGTELSAPIVMDLDPAANPEATPEIPEVGPAKLAEHPGAETAVLTMRSNTPGASLGLMVGYTPGMKLTDLDVSRTYRLLVTAAGYDPRELVIKGRHWEEGVDGSLTYMEHLQLEPRTEPPAGDSEGDALVIDDDQPAEAAPPPQPPPTTPKRKKRKKRRRKKRR